MIGFYWVYWVLLGFPLGRTWFLLDFTEFNCVLLGLTRLLPSLRCHSPPTEANLGILPTFYCVSLIILSFEPCGIRTSSGDLRGTFTTEDRSLVSFFSISRKRRDTHTHTQDAVNQKKGRDPRLSSFFRSTEFVLLSADLRVLIADPPLRFEPLGGDGGGEGAIRKQPTVDAFIGCAKKRSHRNTRRLK